VSAGRSSLVGIDALSLVMDHLPALIAYVDRERRYRFVNRAYERWFGKRREDVVGRTLAEVLGERAAEVLRPRIEAALAGEVVEYEAEVPYKDGGTRWVDGRYVPDVGPDGVVAGYFSLVQDISERKRAERELAQERERLEIALRAGRLGVYEWRVGAAEVWWSPETYAVYGVHETFRPTVEAFTALVHPDDREELWRKTQACLESREVFTHEYRVVRPDGQVRWVFNRSHVGVGASGAVERITGVAADITERKLVEEAMRASEERFRQLADAMPQLVWIARDDGAVTYYNRRAEAFAGIGQPLGPGTPWEWAPAVHPEDMPRTRAAWEGAVQARAAYECEHRIKMKDGSYRWHLSRATRVGDGAGQWYGTATDIHDLKLAQEATRESEERFREMADGLPLIVWVHGPDGGQEFVNHTFCEFFGVTREEMRSGRWQMLMDEESGPGYLAEFLRCNAERVPFNATVKVRVAGGRWRWIESWGRPRFAGSGEYLGMIGASADVTARLEAEAALRESEERFRRMADHAPVMVWVTEPDGACSYLSASWYEYTGQTPETGLGMGWLEAVHPDDRGMTTEAFIRANAERGPFKVEYRLLGRDGTYRWAIDAATPRVGPSGEYLGYIGSVLDISDRKAAEEELSRYRAGLEAMVAERTRQLEESSKRLRDSERLASLGTLTAGLGHDLHNALLPLRVHVEELLEASRREPAIGENAAAIEAITSYLASLSRGMRMLSKDPAQGAEEGETDLLEWERSAGRVLGSAVGRAAELVVRVERDVARVKLADHRLTQAVFNLVQNARDAVVARWGEGKGGRIELLCAPGADQTVVVSVSDNGIGMDERTVRRCVEPFFTTKVRGARTDQGGTGMGLSLVSAYVQAAGGRLDVESKLGEGSVFRLVLPATEAPGIAAGGDRPVASVTLGDERRAAAVRAVLAAAGWEVKLGGVLPAENARLWVTDAEHGGVVDVRRFSERAGAAGVVVLTSGDGYAGERVRTYDPARGFTGLRGVLEGFRVESLRS